MMPIHPSLVGKFRDRNPESLRRWESACEAMPLGVSSTYQFMDPWPPFVERAAGARLYDADGNETIDFAMSHGALLVGHAHPAVVKAVQEQASRGTIYCHPTDLAVEVARELLRRYPIDGLVRFTNSGTESTMHALRLARAHTGRERVIKFEGHYHGAHDALLVSNRPAAGQMGRADRPASLPVWGGIPRGVVENTLVATFNNLDSVAWHFERHLNGVAAVILEPVMMNFGLVEPEPGFLQGLRDLCDRNGALLIYDEVKTGVKIAPGGAVERYGVRPDIVCLSKAMGGGMPIGAFIGRRDVMEAISAYQVAHFGTYNGNPISLAAARAALFEVLTPATYSRIEALQAELCAGYDRVIREAGLKAHTLRVGTVGAVLLTDEPVRNLRDWARIPESLLGNYYTGLHNQGVLVIQEQWIVSAMHAREDIERHLKAFATLAPFLVSLQSGRPL
jgi:glutamate-1-semialdehyde 2,1-aminomutase